MRPWMQAGVVFGLFFGGGAVGVLVAKMVAPGSDVATFVAFLTLPFAFVTGFQLWLGAAIVAAVPRIVRSIRGYGWNPAGWPRPAHVAEIPPGSGAFVATGAGCGTLAGLVVGLVPAAPGVVAATATFLSLGIAFGLLAAWLARVGLLPFPDGD